MSEISKIVIKGTSGFCCADETYEDKVTVTGESIAYEYRPLVETEINVSRQWAYKTTSPIFKKLFADLVKVMPAVVNYEEDMICSDVGEIEFILTYSDKSIFKRSFCLPGDEFGDCFRIIKQMVPGCEYVPAVLLTRDDYQE